MSRDAAATQSSEKFAVPAEAHRSEAPEADAPEADANATRMAKVPESLKQLALPTPYQSFDPTSVVVPGSAPVPHIEEPTYPSDPPRTDAARGSEASPPAPSTRERLKRRADAQRTALRALVPVDPPHVRRERTGREVLSAVALFTFLLVTAAGAIKLLAPLLFR